jgi:hypothetical protein
MRRWNAFRLSLAKEKHSLMNTYYYVDTCESIATILRDGFSVNNQGKEKTTGKSGVYLVDAPGALDPDHDQLLEIKLPPALELSQFENKTGGTWLVPAHLLDEWAEIRLLPKEEWNPKWEEWLEQVRDLIKHPPTRAVLKRYDSDVGLITVTQAITDMGLEPTPELVLAVEEATIEWFEHEFKNASPIDDGGLSCYYTFNGNYYYREEIFRTKIEEIVRLVRLAQELGYPLEH